MTIEHGHANNFGNDYSSTAFWYQAEPHKPFGTLPAALARRPRDGADPHDRAFASLIALRPKLVALWFQSIRADKPLPPADREYALVSSEWYLNGPGIDEPAGYDQAKAHAVLPDWVTWNAARATGPAPPAITSRA